jgi:hypothetical protein
MERRAVGNGHDRLAETWRRQAAECRAEAQVIEDALRRLEHLAAPPSET